MNGFEVVNVVFSGVVVTVAFDSASWTSTTLEVASLAKKITRKKNYFVVTIRTIN